MYNYKNIPTPSYVVEEELLIKNLEILKNVIEKTGCKILLAQKCFSMFYTYPLISKYISGTTASGLFEAKLGKEYMEGETHVYSSAFREDEFDEVVEVSDHIVFNSFNQFYKYRDKALQKNKKIGLRINPECTTQTDHEIYDPCSPFSRMGIIKKEFENKDIKGISGLHFHTLCEQNSDDLVTTIKAVEEKFGEYLYDLEWLNFGGGHHITRDDYDVELLIKTINYIQEKYKVLVYLEPGEAVALNAGFLVSTVLDIVENGKKIAILDTSAACHMPDVIEMPYTPQIIGAKTDQSNPYAYRLAGPTCLAGDIIGDYTFEKELNIGDRVIFCDMAIYSMVKNNTFNGINLPKIAYKSCDKQNENDENISIIRSFGYEDFKMRLS